MHLEGPTSTGLMYSDTGGDGPVVVTLHGVWLGGSLWATVIKGLRDRFRCIVPELPFGAHTTPMPDDLFRSWIHPPLRDLTEPRLSPPIAAKHPRCA